MKHSTAHLRLVSLLSLVLLACTAAYGQITPSADSYTNTVDPSTNFGAKIVLDVESPSQTSYIQFNLSSLPAGYTSADITKATLKLYVFSVTTPGNFNVDYVNGTWAENTITSNLAPALGTTIAASVPLVAADKNQYILIDVTEAVQAWLSGTPNDGIALVGNSPFNATFDSKENTATSHAPELDIVFAGGGTLTGVTTASGSGLTGGGTSGTLNLGLLTTCSSGQVLKWNGSAWACATSSGTGTVTSVASGAGLTGGPITGSGTLSIATGGVTNAMLADSYAQLGAANTFTGNQTLTGTLTANSSANAIIGNSSGTSGYGVEGSSPGVGVFGQSLTPSGSGGIGVAGESNGPAGAGLSGSNTAATGLAMGVYGTTSSTTGFGVVGAQGSGTVVSGIPAGVYGTTGSTTGYGVEGAVNSPGAYGVFGSNSATTTGEGAGVFGTSSSPGGNGVVGRETAVTGFAWGVGGLALSPDGVGTVGQNSASSGGIGVYGSAEEPLGTNFAPVGIGVGVFGITPSPSGYGVAGTNIAASGTAPGVYGTSTSTSGVGVFGDETAATGSTAGVFGLTSSAGGFGVQGSSPFAGVVGFPGTFEFSTAGAPYGVVGSSTAVGVYGASSGLSGFSFGDGAGVWGDTGGSIEGDYVGVLGTAGDNSAGFFINKSTDTNVATIYAINETTTAGGEVFVAEMQQYLSSGGAAVFAIIGDPGCGAGDNRIAIQLSQGGMSNCNNYTLTAGNNGETYVNADPSETVHLRVGNNDSLVASSSGVNVVGTLSKGGGSFKIDHPLDPANKYLYHSFVESPDMMNIYNGNVTTDGAGLATVTLPAWFESLNRDFRYQLTVIGQFAQVIVASEISGNHFSIRTDKPSVKVSWQVTGVRQDAFANANRIPVEVEKAPADRGRYLYPEAIGQPVTARIGYEAPPPGSEHIAHQRPTISRHGSASPTAGRAPVSPPAPPMHTMQKHSLPPQIQPQPTMPRVAPLPHPVALAGKPQVNQK
jgi:hypothetical protein